MPEIKKPLRRLDHERAVIARGEGVAGFEAPHSHADILRYVIADVGAGEARCIIDKIEAEEAND